ncbi:hypothetical protein CBR_g22956 [Chara braunii]|uniref:Uncharacterized protein n=1 Tax=Chara braunii TaxID=69332 RepID=A0A388L350_CHABU|nr:hypothetical protein CBR_g22956 [Chara braunii]|eukprot:GBG76739.1 hypothetical protein CBR_g22956 [Chara braunii]
MHICCVQTGICRTRTDALGSEEKDLSQEQGRTSVGPRWTSPETAMVGCSMGPGRTSGEPQGRHCRITTDICGNRTGAQETDRNTRNRLWAQDGHLLKL